MNSLSVSSELKLEFRDQFSAKCQLINLGNLSTNNNNSNSKMKRLTVFAFIGLFAFAIANNTLSHNLELGHRMAGDRHLIREVVFAKSAVMQRKRGDYTFEPRNVPYPARITYVKVQDQYTNGKGGYATLTSGGPGFTFVKLHFTSQWWRGYNFIIDIFGM